MKKVVIVGAGFAGLGAARKLARVPGLSVTVIDEKNHHLFQPLLYQVAMAGLSPAEIAMPIRSILSGDGGKAEVLMGRVTGIDLAARKVKWHGPDIAYDYLVIACGATHSYFGHDEWEEHAPGLKTLEQATEIRRRVLSAFEQAERESDPATQREWLTFAVVGGGPTGVELAGALGEISRYTLSKDFVHIDPRRTRIILIEAGPRILPTFDAELTSKAARDLERLGVTVWTSTRVTTIREDGVSLGQEFVRARTVLWAAGVKPSPIGATLGVPLDAAGRVVVADDLSLPGHPEVFCVGDQAHFKDAEGKALPGLAPVAMQQGKHVAKNLLARMEGRPTTPFRYVDKGQMATIGRRRAIAQTGSLKLTGMPAWWAWLLVHIYYLVGFRNRLFVMLQWAWGYLFYRRGARLIVSKEWRATADGPLPMSIDGNAGANPNANLGTSYGSSTGVNPPPPSATAVGTTTGAR